MRIRIARLENLYDDVLKERLALILQRLDQLYEKTERDEAEILAKLKVTELYEKTERNKTEIFTKMEKDKRELIKWMIGLLVGFFGSYHNSHMGNTFI